MSTEKPWTQSMRQAWQYAVSSLDFGLTVAEGVYDYRAGGGHIATTDWNYLRARANEAFRTGEFVAGMPEEAIVPSTAHVDIGWDYEQRYVCEAQISYIDNLTGESVRRNITVESDETMTVDNWTDAITEAGAGYDVQGGSGGVTVEKSHFYRAMWSDFD
jgi:hypothetical protein